ncbi:MMPL family transporter [Propionibacteriaceae bacterium Y2011]
MSTFLYGLGRAAFRRRWLTLVSWVVVLAVLGGFAAAFSKPFQDEFDLPGSEAQAALESLSHTFPQVSGASAQIIVVAPEGGTVEQADVRAAIDTAVRELSGVEQVENVVSPYDEMVSGSVSEDERAALINIQLNTRLEEVTDQTLDEILAVADGLRADVPGSDASAGGQAFQVTEVGLGLVDVIGVFVALIVLWVTLGSLRAAGLPLLTAIWGVGISTLLVVGGTAVMVISSTTIMLSLMLGLAVGIDYALFILSRHRDQLATGMDPEESAARSVATSGSAVVFAGLTVMIALCGLSVAGMPFLTTMGVAAAAAVAIAVMIALTAIPALMGLMGEKLRPKPKKEKQPGQPQHGVPATAAKPKRGWADRWVGAATKLPVLTIVVIVLGLGALAIPASQLRLALPDAGSNPAGSPARVTYDLVSEHFGPGHNGPLIMTVDIVASDDPLGVMEGLADDIEALPGVATVPLSTPNPGIDTGIVQIVPTTGPDDPATSELVRQLRDLQPQFRDEYGVDTAVTGITAVQIDVSDKLAQALLPFGLLVVGLSLILLTMVFRSILVPIKAALGYVLSVVASFGVVALVFEYGWGAELLGLDKTGPVISFLPIILMGILFGLAMDYEVFLVSRIREDHVHGVPAREAVRTGFVASARVVLAAGLIMFAVFAAFVPEGDAILKSIALGLAVGIFVDAFIVRMTLVPAVLKLLGEAAWYLPPWLDKRLPSFDVEGEGLQRQLALADWPMPGFTAGIAAESIMINDEPVLGGPVVLQPGRPAVLTGGDATTRTSVLLAFTARTAITEGRLKVAGQVLPDHGGSVRRHTVYVDAADTGAAAQIRRAQRAGHAVIAVDNADRADTATVTAMQELITATAGRPTVVVLAAAGPLPINDATVVDLSPARPATALVNA